MAGRHLTGGDVQSGAIVVRPSVDGSASAWPGLGSASGLGLVLRLGLRLGLALVLDGGARTEKRLQDFRVPLLGRVVGAAPEVLIQRARESRVRVQSSLHAR